MAVLIHDPGNHLLRIDKVWMAVSVDDDGNEGLCAAPMPGHPGFPIPLIAADEARLPFVRDMARRMAKMTGKRIRIVRLHERTEEEVIDP